MLRVDMEPEPGMVFEARNRALHALPGLQLMEAQASPVRVSRNGRYLADGSRATSWWRSTGRARH